MTGTIFHEEGGFMAKENKTKFALLGVLNLNPATGYDIKKFCYETISHFWNENYSHIYPVLEQLKEEGLAEKEIEIHEGKLRNVYKITESGRQKYIEWLGLPPEIPQERYEFLLKMFFSKDIPVKSVIDRLNESKKFCESVLCQYERFEQNMKNDLSDKSKQENGMLFWYITVRYGILDMKAKILWCDESIEMLKLYFAGSKEENVNEDNCI
jgi:DNA-binding PadR family transcriptional regulator